MKEKIIALIKKYRAASEKLWTPTEGYKSWTDRGISLTYDKCATDLEELLRHLSTNPPKLKFKEGSTPEDWVLKEREERRSRH